MPRFASSRPSPRLRTASRGLGIAVLLAGASLAASPGLHDASARQAIPQAPAATSSAVSFEVLVTRNGVPVDALTAADVVLRDAGVVQTPQVEPASSRPLSVQLAFDASASVRGPALDHLKAAARSTLAALSPADDAGLITFSHVVTRRIAFTSSKTDFDSALASIVAQGSTALTDAVAASLMASAAPGRRWLIVVFSDGDDTASWLSPADALEDARRSSAVMSSVLLEGTGNLGASIAKSAGDRTARQAAPLDQWLIVEPGLYRSALLPRLAAETGGDLVTIADTAKLAATVGDIVARVNRRYVITYTPTGVPARGWHPIQLEVKGADVVSRLGFLR